MLSLVEFTPDLFSDSFPTSFRSIFPRESQSQKNWLKFSFGKYSGKPFPLSRSASFWIWILNPDRIQIVIISWYKPQPQ